MVAVVLALSLKPAVKVMESPTLRLLIPVWAISALRPVAQENLDQPALAESAASAALEEIKIESVPTPDEPIRVPVKIAAALPVLTGALAEERSSALSEPVPALLYWQIMLTLVLVASEPMFADHHDWIM